MGNEEHPINVFTRIEKPINRENLRVIDSIENHLSNIPRNCIMLHLTSFQPAVDNSAGDSLYEWHLTDVERAKRFRKPKGQPQPVWFTPF
jgi:hypothetical protein